MKPKGYVSGPGAGGDLVSAIASRFQLGSPIGAMTPVSQGIQGRVFSLRTEAGRWAVKLLFEGAESRVIETGVRLQDAARQAGVASPRSIRSENGNIVEPIGHERVRVHSWLDLGPAVTVPAERSVVASVGATLARLHGLALAAPSGVSSWLRNPPPQEGWSELLTRARAVSAPWQAQLAEALPTITQLTRIALGVPPSATVLCHCDLIPGNVARSPDHGVVVLDWERAGAQAPAQELGYVLSHWCWSSERGVDAQGAAALTRAYRREAGSERPRIDIDLGMGLFGTAICSWLNFTRSIAAAALGAPDPAGRRRVSEIAGSMLGRPLSPSILGQLADEVRSRGRA